MEEKLWQRAAGSESFLWQSAVFRLVLYPVASNLHGKRLKIIDVVGQAFSIGPLTDIGLFLGFVAATAGAVGSLAVLLATLAMTAFSLVVAFYASETGGAGAIGDYIERAWGWRAGKGTGQTHQNEGVKKFSG